mmetsp:Transcript_12959/g.14046  ORF Transcript_12959/g.14046 Transcript_12959/m.14046 type:complete len:101 (+) Transcript_12959:200-502(+)
MHIAGPHYSKSANMNVKIGRLQTRSWTQSTPTQTVLTSTCRNWSIAQVAVKFFTDLDTASFGSCDDRGIFACAQEVNGALSVHCRAEASLTSLQDCQSSW